MNRNHYGPLAVIGAAILWSLDGLLRKNLYGLPPSVVVFWEHLFGIIILLPILFYFRKKMKKFSRQQIASIVSVSFLSGALGTVLYTAALTNTQFSPFSVVVLLQQLQPIFAIAAAAVVLKEKISPRLIGLGIIALIAAYFTAFPDLTVNFDTGKETALGALFAIGAAASWGVSTALSKYSLKDVPSFEVTAARFAIVPFFALLFVVGLGDFSEISVVTADQWRSIIAITFSTGMVALGLYYYGLKRVLASRSTILELAWPASALIIGFVFLDESFTATQWFGAGVLTGVIAIIAHIQNKATDSAK